MFTKTTIHIDSKALAKIKSLALVREETATILINRAIAMYIYMAEKQLAGCKILIEDPDGTLTRILETGE